MNVFDVLIERGFVKQCSDEAGLRNLFAKKENVVFYVGFDPTADSLHIGSLVPIMAMAHLQKAGNTPICIIGGGTAMIGDPSGKTKIRRTMNQSEIEENCSKIASQIKHYLTPQKNLIFANNAEWLLNLKHIDFLRDIGRHFKVNEMIKSEAYKQRLDRQEGLSFIEFNYQLLQAYDFLVLFDKHNCRLQMGGDDQWGNMLAGVNLVRRMRNEDVYALTFPLLTTARGDKMGKTETGAIWLDADKTSPYEFYQYWINIDDNDVVRFLNYFTFVSKEEIAKIKELKGANLRSAKETLAYEATKLTHGENEAQKVRISSRAVFESKIGNLESMPTIKISQKNIATGIPVIDILCMVKLVATRSEARRLISQGGIYINDQKVNSLDFVVGVDLVKDSFILIRRGKKQYCRVLVENL